MDSLIQKAWELYQHTASFPAETILTATVWLEDKYRKAPGANIAMAIALDYLILPLRHDGGRESAAAEEYCARAARWQTKSCKSSAAIPGTKGTEQN